MKQMKTVDSILNYYKTFTELFFFCSEDELLIWNPLNEEDDLWKWNGQVWIFGMDG